MRDVHEFWIQCRCSKWPPSASKHCRSRRTAAWTTFCNVSSVIAAHDIAMFSRRSSSVDGVAPMPSVEKTLYYTLTLKQKFHLNLFQRYWWVKSVHLFLGHSVFNCLWYNCWHCTSKLCRTFCKLNNHSWDMMLGGPVWCTGAKGPSLWQFKVNCRQPCTHISSTYMLILHDRIQMFHIISTHRKMKLLSILNIKLPLVNWGGSDQHKRWKHKM